MDGLTSEASNGKRVDVSKIPITTAGVWLRYVYFGVGRFTPIGNFQDERLGFALGQGDHLLVVPSSRAFGS